MIANLAAQDAIAQNLANVSTTGYKQDVPRFESFQTMLLDRMSGAGSTGAGTLGRGVTVDGVATDFAQGSLERTGSSFDIALTGDAYLAVKTPTGVLYSRDGAMTRDDDGTLIQASSRAPILDSSNRPIQIPADAGEISISSTGEISAAGKTLGQIGLVDIDETSGAEKVGGNLYQASAPHAVSATDTVQQGYLETSNVSIVKEMVSMIAVQRNYETNQKMLQAQDEITGKAISQVAAQS